MIVYSSEPELNAAEFAELLRGSGLSQRRPTDPERLASMLRGAQLVITARDGDRLVGVARSVTDWAYCLYCSDLCVDLGYQGRGIGKTLLEHTAAAAPMVKTCLLLSAPDAVGFYEAAGFSRHAHAFIFAQRK